MDTLHEKQNNTRWTAFIEEWKSLILRNTLNSFKEFMEHRQIASPTEMDRLKEELTTEQKKAGERRKELIEWAMELKPPKVSPAMVYEWREEADKLYEDLGITGSSQGPALFVVMSCYQFWVRNNTRVGQYNSGMSS